MNRFIISLMVLSLTIISCKKNKKAGIVSSFTIDKSKKNYYINDKGEVLDSTSYLSERKSQLEKFQKISSSFRLYEKLDKRYEKNDSVVYHYSWHFSDRIEKIIEQDKKINQNIGTVYPISNAETLRGEIINIEDLKGKPTLVNLWFTKCAPCIEEIPTLNKMKSKYGTRFNFLSVTMDKTITVQKFLEKNKFNFTHIVNSSSLTTDLGFNGFPINLFLDKEGTIQKIEGNIPYVKDVDGKMVMSNGGEFIKLLKRLE